jgi:hypothetical protein
MSRMVEDFSLFSWYGRCIFCAGCNTQNSEVKNIGHGMSLMMEECYVRMVGFFSKKK